MAKFRSFTRNASFLFLGSIILSSTALAASSVATVTSANAFVLDGHSVSSPGVTSFPVVSGDIVATPNGPAVLRFQDGSTVKLAESSSAKVETDGKDLKVVLLSGSLDYKLIPGSNVKVTNLDAEHTQATSTPADATQSVSSGRSRIASVMSSPAFILSAGGTAAGVVLGLVNPFSSGSSSNQTAAQKAAALQPKCIISHVPGVSVHL